MKIEIIKKEILHAVKLETFVSGEATKEKEEYQSTKSQADNDNNDTLLKYLSSAESRIVDVLKGYLTEVDVSDSEKIIYILDVPVDFDTNQSRVIQEGMKDFLVNYILWKWFSCTWPQKAEQYKVSKDEILFDIKHRINQKKTSARRKVRPIGF